MLEKDFKEIVLSIKREVSNTQYEIMKQANKQLIGLYFRLGKIISENSKWGNKFIDNLAVELKLEFSNIKGFSVRNLKNMKRYYNEYSSDEFMQTLSAQIPWSHNLLLIEKIKDMEIRKWYIEKTIINSWSYNVLAFQIDTDIYQRQVLVDKSNNFDNTLSTPQNDLAKEMMKDPYIFDLANLKKQYIEIELEKAMIERIKNILLELGNGFSFVGNQYKLVVDDKDYYIDMLFYHLKLRCYIVVELKAREYKPEDAGKLNFYLSAVDDMIKDKNDNLTIGIILCKNKNKFTVEYSLKDINKPIGVSSYEISKVLPKDIIDKLPSEEDINLHIDIVE